MGIEQLINIRYVRNGKKEEIRVIKKSLNFILYELESKGAKNIVIEEEKRIVKKYIRSEIDKYIDCRCNTIYLRYKKGKVVLEDYQLYRQTLNSLKRKYKDVNELKSKFENTHIYHKLNPTTR